MNTEIKAIETKNRESSLSAVLKLAWPVSLQSVLAATLGMIDIMMVAHLGEESVAGMGLANRILFVLLMIGSAFGVTAGIFIAQFAGAKKFEAVPVIIAQVLIIATAIMLPLMILTSIFGQQLSQLGSNSAYVINVSSSYLSITLPSILFLLVYQVFEGGLRGLKQVYVPLLFGAITMMLNIVLNFALINGVSVGTQSVVAAMGTDGAAWATTISRILLLAGLLSYLLYKKHICLPSNSFVSLKNPECSWSTILKNGLPLTLNFGVWALGTFVYQIIFGSLGSQSLAVMSILAPIEGTLMSLFLGFATAASVLIGQKLGANEMDKAYRLGTRLTLAITAFAAVLGIMVMLAQQWVLSPYQQYSADTLRLATQVLIVMCIGLSLKTANMMLSLGVLRAGGDNRFCLFTDTLGMWFIGIPLTWLIAGETGALIWIVVTTYSEELSKSALFFWRLLSRKWQRNMTQSNNKTHCSGTESNTKANPEPSLEPETVCPVV